MQSEQAAILVVDDERSVTDLLSDDLAEEGYICATATTGEEALKRLSVDNFNVMLLDLRLPGISGMDVLREAKSNCPETVVIVITAAGDAQTAVEAMKIGAVDYITKPFELERVNSSVEAVLKAKTVWSCGLTPKEERAKATSEETDWMHYLDAIAAGVECRLDSFTGHMMTLTVIERTVTIARSLDIPNGRIEKWADVRRRDIEKVKTLDRLLEKIEPGPVAQVHRKHSFILPVWF